MCVCAYVCVCVHACVCFHLCWQVTGKAVLITTHPHTMLTASERTSPPPPTPPNMTISTISCLLSLPFISLLFIYLHFVHIYSPGNTSFEPLTRAPAILPQTQNFFSPFVSGLTLTRAFSSFDTCFFKSSWEDSFRWMFGFGLIDLILTFLKLRTDGSSINNCHTNEKPIRGIKWHLYLFTQVLILYTLNQIYAVNS